MPENKKLDEPVHVMCDLETLSTKSNAAIASIGAVVFYQNGVAPSSKEGAPKTFYIPVDIEAYDSPSLDDKFHISGSTFKWWLGMSDEAREQLRSDKAHSLEATLVAFQNWLKDVAPDAKQIRLWGNGSDFDNVILANAYGVYGEPAPWKFYNNRCYRTFKNLHGHQVSTPPIDSNKAHNAYEDAVYQASHLLAMAEAAKIDLNLV